MRDFVLVKLTDEEFDDFSARHPQGNFQQTSAMGRLRAAQGIDVEYLALKEGEKIVAAALFETHRSRFSTFAVIHDGPMCDYHDTEALTFFMDALKRHAKAKGASQLEITPESPYRLRDTNGASLPDDQNGAPDNKLIEQLEAIGFTHGGFTVGYESVVNRWNFVKGLDGIHDEKELLASFSKYRRKNIRIAQDSGLRVRRLERGELSTFVKLCDMSAARQGFKSRDLAYYERLFDTFGDLIEFKVVETHFDEYLDTLQSKLNAASKDKRNLERLLQRAQQQPEGTAKKGASDPATLEKRIATADKKIAALEKTIGEVNGIIASDGPVIPVEAGVYFWHPNEVVCLSSGEDDRFMDYYPSSLIHFEAMLDCIARGVERFNFYGISGIFDANDPSYGVWQFKTRFGGFVEELPGKFTLPVDGLRFGVSEAAHKLLHR